MENQKGHRAFQGSVWVRILSVPKKAIFRSFVFFLKLRLKKSLKRPIGCAFTRIRSKLTFIDGGSGWIRTTVGVRQQIYSLPPLATRELLHINQNKLIIYSLAYISETLN